jgi:hypothetical protein
MFDPERLKQERKWERHGWTGLAMIVDRNGEQQVSLIANSNWN